MSKKICVCGKESNGFNKGPVVITILKGTSLGTFVNGQPTPDGNICLGTDKDFIPPTNDINTIFNNDDDDDADIPPFEPQKKPKKPYCGGGKKSKPKDDKKQKKKKSKQEILKSQENLTRKSSLKKTGNESIKNNKQVYYVEPNDKATATSLSLVSVQDKMYLLPSEEKLMYKYTDNKMMGSSNGSPSRKLITSGSRSTPNISYRNQEGLLPIVKPRYHGDGCALEVSILEKHSPICSHKKQSNRSRDPLDDRSGSYEVIGRMAFQTCNGSAEIADANRITEVYSFLSETLNNPFVLTPCLNEKQDALLDFRKFLQGTSKSSEQQDLQKHFPNWFDKKCSEREETTEQFEKYLNFISGATNAEKTSVQPVKKENLQKYLTHKTQIGSFDNILKTTLTQDKMEEYFHELEKYFEHKKNVESLTNNLKSSLDQEKYKENLQKFEKYIANKEGSSKYCTEVCTKKLNSEFKTKNVENIEQKESQKTKKSVDCILNNENLENTPVPTNSEIKKIDQNICTDLNRKCANEIWNNRSKCFEEQDKEEEHLQELEKYLAYKSALEKIDNSSKSSEEQENEKEEIFHELQRYFEHKKIIESLANSSKSFTDPLQKYLNLSEASDGSVQSHEESINEPDPAPALQMNSSTKSIQMTPKVSTMIRKVRRKRGKKWYLHLFGCLDSDTEYSTEEYVLVRKSSKISNLQKVMIL